MYELSDIMPLQKSNKGQLTRQEAGFLLLHHAMDSSTHDDLLAAGAVNACVGVLDNASCNSPEASTASGEVLRILEGGRAKRPGGSGTWFDLCCSFA